VQGSGVNNNAESPESQQPGMRLRSGLTVAIYNTAVRDFDIGCIRIDDADIKGDGSDVYPSDVTLVNVLGECQDAYYQKREANEAINSGERFVTVDNAYALTDADASVAAPTIPAINNGFDFTFDDTDYVGAVKPGTDRRNASGSDGRSRAHSTTTSKLHLGLLSPPSLHPVLRRCLPVENPRGAEA
jgi:hypothetical protein